MSLSDGMGTISGTVRHFANPRAEHDSWPARLDAILDGDAFDMARDHIEHWQGYEPTPLHSLQTLAAAAGVASVHYKDESTRFGLGSFKALGGAYAVLRLLMQQSGLDAEQIYQRHDPERIAGITVVTATDGNHGRSVAWGARQFGCACRIYIHAGVSTFRESAMRELGAHVVRIEGNYDESVRRASADADANNWFVVSDTSWEGYTELPRYVMAGYGVMIDEAIAQLGGEQWPTHVFVQGGVGGLAAAVAARLWQKGRDARPTIVVVEPNRCDCLYQSACNSGPVRVAITEESIMAGLSCGEVSLLAWSILETGADHFLSIGDDDVAMAMRMLATGGYAPTRIIAGESAVAGLLGFIAAARDATLSSVMGLNATSRILLFGTEGATDPGIYRKLTGVDIPGGAD